jgi:hypothetical protein
MKNRSLIFGLAVFVCSALIFSGCEQEAETETQTVTTGVAGDFAGLEKLLGMPGVDTVDFYGDLTIGANKLTIPAGKTVTLKDGGIKLDTGGILGVLGGLQLPEGKKITGAGAVAGSDDVLALVAASGGPTKAKLYDSITEAAAALNAATGSVDAALVNVASGTLTADAVKANKTLYVLGDLTVTTAPAAVGNVKALGRLVFTTDADISALKTTQYDYSNATLAATGAAKVKLPAEATLKATDATTATLTIDGAATGLTVGSITVKEGAELSVSANVKLTISGNATIDGKVTVASDATLTVDEDATFTVAGGVVVGGTLDVNGKIDVNTGAEVVVVSRVIIAPVTGDETRGVNNGVITIKSSGELESYGDSAISGSGKTVVDAGGKVAFAKDNAQTPEVVWYIGPDKVGNNDGTAIIRLSTTEGEEGKLEFDTKANYALSGKVSFHGDTTGGSTEPNPWTMSLIDLHNVSLHLKADAEFTIPAGNILRLKNSITEEDNPRQHSSPIITGETGAKIVLSGALYYDGREGKITDADKNFYKSGTTVEKVGIATSGEGGGLDPYRKVTDAAATYEWDAAAGGSGVAGWKAQALVP